MEKVLTRITLIFIIVVIGTAASQTVNETNENAATTVTSIDLGEEARNHWLQLEKVIKSTIQQITKKIMPTLIRSGSELDLSGKCMESLLKFVLDLQKLKSWAFKMMDAWGKPAGGIVYGLLTFFGSYDECVDIVVNTRRNDGFQGQYCAIDIHPSLPPRKRWYTMYETLPEFVNISSPDSILRDMVAFAQFFNFLSMRFGTCFPSTCSKHDVEKISRAIIKASKLKVRTSVPFCEIKEGWNLKSDQITVLSIIGVLTLMVAIGTTFDTIIRMSKKNKCSFLKSGNGVTKVFLSFSAYTNTSKLFSTKLPENTLSALHGLRFLSVVWVILSHTYLFSNPRIFRRLMGSRAELGQSFGFQFINNGFIAVETFFFMGGLLSSYWRMNNGDKPFNIFHYLLFRFWRLLPSYMFVMGLFLILPLLGSGPMWHETLDPLVRNCRNNWWTNLLFVNNYVHEREMCLEHSWYLAADTQFYILFLVVLIPLVRWPKIALGINFFLLISATIATAFVNMHYNLPPTGLVLFPDINDRYFFETKMYIKPYAHLSSYSIGILVGYFLATRRHVKISKALQTASWCVASVVGISVIFSIYKWNVGVKPTPIESAIYASTSRIAWMSCVAWITISCITGRGGVVNSILSWSAFVPLSRMTYVAYLIHPLVQFTVYAFFHERVYGHHLMGVYFFFGHLVTTLIISYLCSLLVESPFVALGKVIFSQKDEDESTKELPLTKRTEVLRTISLDPEKYPVHSNGIKRQPEEHCKGAVGFDNLTFVRL